MIEENKRENIREEMERAAETRKAADYIELEKEADNLFRKIKDYLKEKEYFN